MPRFLKILVHIAVFLVGLPALLLTNFWAWDLFQGLVLPLVASGFLLYLVFFVALNGYHAFTKAQQRP